MKEKHLKIFYWLIISALAFFIHWDHAVNTDEGEILAGAWRIYQGQIPYHDFFQFVAPGSYYFIAWSFKVLGPYYISAKIFSLLFLILAAAGIYQLSRLYIKNKFYVYCVPLFWLLISTYYPLINHNQFNIFILIWAIYFLLLALKKNKTSLYFTGGILGGLVFLFHQTKGLVFIAIALFLLLIYNFTNAKKFLPLALGFFIAIAPLLYWPLGVIAENLFYFPLNHYLPINQVTSLPAFIYIIIFIWIWWCLFYLKVSREVWYLWWAQFFISLTSLNRPDVFHLIIYSFLLPIIFFVILDRTIDFKPFKFHAYALAGVATICIFLLYFFLDSYFFILQHKSFTEFVFLRSRALDKILAFVPGDSDYLYAGPLLPNLYFEAKKKNISRYNSLLTNFNQPEAFWETREELIRISPPVIFLNYQMVKKFNYDVSNPLDEYIAKNYQVETELYGITVLKKGPAPLP